MHSRRQFLTRSAQAAVALTLARHQAFASAAQKSGLADVYKEDFLLGTALSTHTLAEKNTQVLDLVAREFNAITAENCMKWGVLEPEPGQWQWGPADEFVNYGQEHNMAVVGHTLVWHSQAPLWLFKDEQGNPISKAALQERVEQHINRIMGRYKGKIHTWDVVNEAVDEDKGWRQTGFYKILGPDYMEQIFRLAHAADPNAHLIYNDYNMHDPHKRAFLVDVFKGYRQREVPIHGVGMQTHVGLDYPDLKEFENSMKAYIDLGLALHMTEMEVDVLPVAWEFTGAEISTGFEYSDQLNPYADGLPDKVQQQLTDRYVQMFELFLKYRENIARVTLWGTSDAESWKNNFPVRGRSNYPLLFDRDWQAKPAYHALKKLKTEA